MILSLLWGAPNKARYFGNANSGYVHWIILLRAYVSWSEQSIAVTCWGLKMFVYSIQSVIRWCCMSSVCIASFNNGKIELFEVLGVGKRFFSCKIPPPCMLEVVSTGIKFWIQVKFSFWWSCNITSHHISSVMLIVGNAQEYSLHFPVVMERLCKIGVRKNH